MICLRKSLGVCFLLILCLKGGPNHCGVQITRHFPKMLGLNEMRGARDGRSKLFGETRFTAH